MIVDWQNKKSINIDPQELVEFKNHDFKSNFEKVFEKQEKFLILNY